MSEKVAGLMAIKKYAKTFAKDIGWKSLPHKRLDILLATFGLNLLSLVVPILILQLYDRIIPNQGYNTLIMLTVGILIAMVFEAVLRVCRSHILSWLGERFENFSSTFALFKLFNAHPHFIKKSGVGQHVENIEGTNILREFMAGQGFLVLFDLPFAALFIVVMVYFAGTLVYVPLAVLSLFCLCAFWLGYKLKKQLEERHDVDDRRYNYLIEILSNYHTVKSLGLEEQILRRFERINHQTALTDYKINFLSAEARDLGTVFSYILFTGVIGFGAVEIINGQLTPGVLAACVILSNRLMQPVQAALSVWSRIQYLRIAEKRLQDLYELPQEEESLSSYQRAVDGSIQLKHIWFRYDQDKPWVLEDIQLFIPKNSFTVLYGANGCGKTTLLKLIAGHLSTPYGEVELNHQRIQDLDTKFLRKKIAFITPKSPLFQGSILENLTLFRADLHQKEALTLSEQLGLHEWILRLPQGYQTIVGDELFSMLPSGQRQRICLIRSLLLRPKVLLLDEANTSLDEKGDKNLIEVLKNYKNHGSIIFATHRPSLSKAADHSYCIVNKTLEPYRSETFSQNVSNGYNYGFFTTRV